MSKTTLPESMVPVLELLGTDEMIAFLLAFGGAPIYLAENPKSRSSVAAVIGHERAAELAALIGPGLVTIPAAKPWIAAQLSNKGVSRYQIARQLHVNYKTVYRWLDTSEEQQLSIFDRLTG